MQEPENHLVSSNFFSSGKEVCEILFQNGFPQGKLIEISGKVGGGKSEVILDFLSENRTSSIAWIEEDFTFYPLRFLQRGLQLDRTLFVETSEYLWAASQILKSQIFQVLVLSVSLKNVLDLRRLQLAAEKAGATIFILSEETLQQDTWPLFIQLHVSRNNSEKKLQIKTLKYKGYRKWMLTATG